MNNPVFDKTGDFQQYLKINITVMNRDNRDFRSKNFTKRIPNNNLLVEISDNSDCNRSEASDKLIETPRTLPTYKYRSPQIMGSNRHRPPAADPRFRKVHKSNPLSTQSEIRLDNFIKPPEATNILNSSLQLIKEIPITPKTPITPECFIPSTISTLPPNQAGQPLPYDGQPQTHPDQLTTHPAQSSTHPVQIPTHSGQPPTHSGQTHTHSAQPPTYSRQSPIYHGQPFIYPELPPTHPGQFPNHLRQEPIHPGQNMNSRMLNENERSHNSSQTESSSFTVSHSNCQTDPMPFLEPAVHSHSETIHDFPEGKKNEYLLETKTEKSLNVEIPVFNDWLIEETRKLETILEPKSKKTSEKSTHSSSPSFYSTKSELKYGRIKKKEKISQDLHYKSLNSPVQTAAAGDTENFQAKEIFNPSFWLINGEIQNQADVFSLLNIVLLIIAVLFASLVLLAFFYLLQPVVYSMVDIIYTLLFGEQEIEEEGGVLHHNLFFQRKCSVSIFSESGCAP
ncbi:uncharacterized protein LOC123301076 [Chrysoperla carnea]|uniref:uncharacterized protein LOC123301076 n=1 Tax=Chrysoperla carnea TaxID=189513 RepID=UPI001D06DE07|nr:uncharacterized protein LOC123301076 [Chrysoperla carnea]